MSTALHDTKLGDVNRNISWPVRVGLGIVVLVGVATVALTHYFLTERFAASTANRAELRLALYSGNILSELRRNAIVPELLARDPALIAALGSGDFSQSSQRLISFVDEIGAASLMLLNAEGRAVATTDRNNLGTSHTGQPYFSDALRANATVFSTIALETGATRFTYARRIETGLDPLGVIVVEVDLAKFERAWAGISEAILVLDSAGQVILATEPRWRGKDEAQAIAAADPQNAMERAIRLTSDWAALDPEAIRVEGAPVLRMETPLAFRGWRIVSFTPYARVRSGVNAVLALEIMGFAIFLAFAFYWLNRRTAGQMVFFQRESVELRALNARLQREISERERVQENLAVAEQTLAQSSKLAALGEMSAAVSHELNQPLAAMKTYLAGARLLIDRNRPDEALASFRRVDDLLDRMGAITRQLKSYARKGGDDLAPVDMVDALTSALAMMEPQLRQRKVRLERVLPDTPVSVMGDRVRVEQVMVNLLRNALDATKGLYDPSVEVMLTVGDTVVLSVRDNGHGIEDLDALFEPFYTTKQPGEGVGLGLAISSGIVSDLGGRLMARNAEGGGAVFEMQLPVLNTAASAAE